MNFVLISASKQHILYFLYTMGRDRNKELEDAIQVAIVNAKTKRNNLLEDRKEFADSISSFVGGVVGMGGSLPQPIGAVCQVLGGVISLVDDIKFSWKEAKLAISKTKILASLRKNKDKQAGKKEKVASIIQQLTGFLGSTTALAGFAIGLTTVIAPPVAASLLLASSALNLTSKLIKTVKLSSKSSTPRKLKIALAVDAAASALHTSAGIGLAIAGVVGGLSLFAGPVGVGVALGTAGALIAVKYYHNKYGSKALKEMEGNKDEIVTHDKVRANLKTLSRALSNRAKVSEDFKSLTTSNRGKEDKTPEVRRTHDVETSAGFKTEPRESTPTSDPIVTVRSPGNKEDRPTTSRASKLK